MRKKITDKESPEVFHDDKNWLDLEAMAQVEITSEDEAFPVEGALALNGRSGWRASKAGLQTIRIIFDEPQQVNKINLLFKEEQQFRTQEFVLRCSPATGGPGHEIIRQQYNFSPESSTEQETYTVNLAGVKVLELTITPDVSGGNAHASLSRLRLA